ncbi:MAG: uracil-DNA glycosylase [Mycoplasma sp.]|nr:uracil-DNA glycosylase [Mycoplasma sp.]
MLMRQKTFLTKDEQNELNNIFSKIDWSNSVPSKQEVNKIFNFNINEIKVVILGQDPYYRKGVANGHAFAVNKDVKIPPSLKTIFKEIEETFGQIKTDRTLHSWVEQGVLLLNTSLTTEINIPNKHKSIWKTFTNKLIESISKRNPNIVWILWGNNAIEKTKYIYKYKEIITDAHPSPLSSYKRKKDTFKKVSNIVEIEW